MRNSEKYFGAMRNSEEQCGTPKKRLNATQKLIGCWAHHVHSRELIGYWAHRIHSREKDYSV